MLHIASLISVLSLVWVFLSGYFIPLIISLGILSVLLVVLIAHRMDTVDHETHPIHLASSAATYFPWLIWEIIKSNFDVCRTILGGNDRIKARLLIVKASQRSEIGRVVYANSITLTPGTVVVGLQNDIFTVHSLTPTAYSGLKTGLMDKKVFNMELDTGGPSAKDQPALNDNIVD